MRSVVRHLHQLQIDYSVLILIYQLFDLTRKDQLRSRVAKVYFCAKRVRSDLLPVVRWLATSVTAPTEQGWDKL